jgi:hypothetical protein
MIVISLEDLARRSGPSAPAVPLALLPRCMMALIWFHHNMSQASIVSVSRLTSNIITPPW